MADPGFQVNCPACGALLLGRLRRVGSGEPRSTENGRMSCREWRLSDPASANEGSLDEVFAAIRDVANAWP